MRNPWVWAGIILLVLILFAAPKLPIFAKSLGQSLKIFKKEMKNEDIEDPESSDSANSLDKKNDSKE
ncbi:MAG: twin-arginine translocase TatA/TatE family subunit [Microbacteriaceae bacterium]|nr:twin-arginine translocase TatA/TatE family subunit [Microbacteriaceae bacterium]